MSQKYEIDIMDKKILAMIQKDSRKPYLEIARELRVSGGTIHARIKKMKEFGIIKGTKVVLDQDSLGFKITAFVGIGLNRAGASNVVAKELEKLPEVLEVHYTTGDHSLLVKVAVKESNDLHLLLANKIQNIENIQSTNTTIILKTMLNREVSPMTVN